MCRETGGGRGVACKKGKRKKGRVKTGQFCILRLKRPRDHGKKEMQKFAKSLTKNSRHSAERTRFWVVSLPGKSEDIPRKRAFSSDILRFLTPICRTPRKKEHKLLRDRLFRAGLLPFASLPPNLPREILRDIPLKSKRLYAAPIGAFFCPEICAFTARFLQPFPKSLVTVKYYSSTKMAVNSR